LSDASSFVEVIEKRQGLKVACLEEIAWQQGWISDDKLMEIATSMNKNQYGEYLSKLIVEVNGDQ
jgi:glucose-1-phosphate thymidylyltransferase